MFLIVLCLFFVSLVVVGALYWLRARRSASGSLEVLLGRLQEVDRHKIARMATGFDESTDPSEEDTLLEGWQMWEMIGGLRGLESMAANCQVLVDLACYVQKWHPEALVVAEDLRRNARELQWHIGRLKGAEIAGHLQATFPDYAPRAATIYQAMTRRVLELYEATQSPGAAQLQQVL